MQKAIAGNAQRNRRGLADGVELPALPARSDKDWAASLRLVEIVVTDQTPQAQDRYPY